MKDTALHVDGQRDRLKDLISYFACKVDHLPEVKLGKLIYIAHLYHYAEYGDLLTETRFVALGFGALQA